MLYFLLNYILVCGVLLMILLLLSALLVPSLFEEENLSTYECGFNPYGDASGRFEIRFYIVAILFIVFDLELVFLFPWVLVINNSSLVGIIVMFFFIALLVEGLVYELNSGSLDWNV